MTDGKPEVADILQKYCAYRPEESGIADVNELLEERLTFAQRASDRFTAFIGSWTFIIIQSGILLIWVLLNAWGWISQWDPYPFIFMNLILSLEAAYAGPVIMMSQKRQDLKDRIEAHNDFLVNRKAEHEVRLVMEALLLQNRELKELREELSAKLERLESTVKGEAARTT